MLNAHCSPQLDGPGHTEARRLPAALLRVAMAVLCTSVAQAQSDGVSVNVPDACGSKPQFLRELSTLEHAPLRTPRRLSVDIRFSEQDATYTLTLTDAGVTRELSDSSCTTLFKTAVVIAAASAPSGDAPSAADLGAPKQSSSAQRAQLPQPPLVAKPTKEAARLQPRPARRVFIVDQGEANVAQEDVGVQPKFHLGVGAMFGATPKLSIALEGAIALGIGRWSLALAGRYLPQVTTTANQQVRMRTQVWGGALAIGYDIAPVLRGGVGFSANRIQAQAVGIRHPASDSVWFFAPEVELALEAFREGAWSGELLVRGRIALNTPHFELDPTGSVVFSVPRLGAGAFFRLKWAP
jgi:hypothetical protein